jgi:hypothetical protein
MRVPLPVIPSRARSDFRTPVESIGLPKPENLLLLDHKFFLITKGRFLVAAFLGMIGRTDFRRSWLRGFGKHVHPVAGCKFCLLRVGDDKAIGGSNAH